MAEWRSPTPETAGALILFAKTAPAGHRRQALRKGIEPAIRRSLWIPRAPGAIGACFVNKNREHTEQSRYDRDHAHARLLELEHSALIELITLTCVSGLWARMPSPPRASPRSSSHRVGCR
jgi:hypothetical protein